MKYLFLAISLITFSLKAQTLLPVPSTPTTANINAALSGSIAASGTDTYMGSVTGLTTYTGFACDIQFTNANTGASTLNINSLGTKSLKKYSSGSLVDLAVGDISAGARIRFYYNGTYLVMMGGSGTDPNSLQQGSNLLKKNLFIYGNKPITFGADSLGTNHLIPGITALTDGSGVNLESISGSDVGLILLEPDFFRASTKSGSTISISNSPTSGDIELSSTSGKTKVLTGDFYITTKPARNDTLNNLLAWNYSTGKFQLRKASSISGGGGSGWSVAGSTTLTDSTKIIGTSNNIIRFDFDNLGQTSKIGAGLALSNKHSATSGTQEYSPSLTFEGRGHNTSGGNQVVDVQLQVKPINSPNLNSLGNFVLTTKVNNKTPNELLTVDVNSGKMIIKGDTSFSNPPLIEFVRHQGGHEVFRSQFGALGSTEANVTVNMDYTDQTHHYFDSLQNAIWWYMGNVTNSFGFQWVKKGHINHNIYNLYGAVPWSVDVMPNSSTGEAVQGGSIMHAQQIDLIDDNYVSGVALIKKHSTNLEITGITQVNTTALNLSNDGTYASIASNPLFVMKYTGGDTYGAMYNIDNNTNFNRFRFVKNKAGSYNIGAGTKIYEFDLNGGVGFSGVRATSTVLSGFSNLEYYWQTTNSSGSLADRMTLGEEGNLTVTGGFSLGYAAKTANYTVTPADYLVNCTANSFTVTLPTAVGITGRMYIIKNTGTATVITIATASSQTIDGSAPATITGLVPMRLMSDGANWISF